MSSVCFYFQVHQPYRLQKWSKINPNDPSTFFDIKSNREIVQKVSAKCYIPTNNLLLKLIDRYKGQFKIAYSITGVALEQMASWSPEALRTFKLLAETGCVEFLAETYYHSLAAVYSPVEFFEQVKLQVKLMETYFGVRPKCFRNTELIFSEDIGKLIEAAGFDVMITEGADDILGSRSPNYVYELPHSKAKVLLKNYKLSDDIAFRFSNRGWNEYPLTAEKFSNWVHRLSGDGDCVNLFMDYETFGEHQWADSGIFDFMEALPHALLQHPDWNFKTPTEVANSYPAREKMGFHRMISWADIGRDLSAWRGNKIQDRAFHEIYKHEAAIKSFNNPHLLDMWRKFQTSDHFYYMATKGYADGDVHAYFSPYDSPYEAFLNYMNVFEKFQNIFYNNMELAEVKKNRNEAFA
jgi:alpha-amylase